MVNKSMTTPRIIWQISGQCTHDCWYCLPKYRNNPRFKTTEEYLHVIDLLQNYGNRSSIPKLNWKFKGGEPLQFPNFNILLKQIKSKDSYITVETAGGTSWFDIMEISGNIDSIVLTYHYWQNESVLDYIVDMMQDQQKQLKIKIPMLPGKMNECKQLARSLRDKDVNVTEQLLMNEDGLVIGNYSMIDLNIFYGRPEDWVPEPAPAVTAPVWIDPRIDDGSPVYTGKPCWAGVDYLYISSKGFTSGSECGGREIGNVFEPGWTPPDAPFPCSMLFCRSQFDKKNIRIETD
jgi:organic radical activating enzyme